LEVAGFVGFALLGDPVLADHQPAAVGDRGQQMHPGPPTGLGPLAFFPIHRHRRTGWAAAGVTDDRRVQPGMPGCGLHPPIRSGLTQRLRGRRLSALGVPPAAGSGTGRRAVGRGIRRWQRHRR
jgi:hypothetical protein